MKKSSHSPLLRERNCLCIAVFLILSVSAIQTWRSLPARSLALNPPQPRTLVLYAYYEADAVARGNLEFFLHVGVGPVAHPDVDYVIVVNGGTLTLDVPKHVIVMRRANENFDAGAYSHGLQEIPGATLGAYRYIILLNNSVRGPFIPTYLLASESFHWTQAFTVLITDQVKWAGSTINCYLNPHVQTPIVVTDTVGLNIVLKSGVFEPSANFFETIVKWEVGSSKAILQAGYNIASLMTRYRGVDFRDKAFQRCNAEYNPAVTDFNDGLNLDPFEVVFIKVKSTIALPHYNMVRRYTDYLFGRDNISLNEWNSQRFQDALQDALKTETTTAKTCGLVFDVEFYARSNKDLQALPPDSLLEHYFHHGFAERRLHRYKLAAPDKTGGKSAKLQPHCASFLLPAPVGDSLGLG